LGKVRSDADGETVLKEASTITGAMNIDDHLQVEEWWFLVRQAMRVTALVSPPHLPSRC